MFSHQKICSNKKVIAKKYFIEKMYAPKNRFLHKKQDFTKTNVLAKKNSPIVIQKTYCGRLGRVSTKPKLKCHQTEMTPKLNCQQNLSVIKTQVSNLNVTKN